MLKIEEITQLFGNNALRAVITQLLSKKEYPSFTILCGPMGVGKSTTAQIIARKITQNNLSIETSVHTINCGAKPDIGNIEANFLRFSPTEPIVLILEEFHSLWKEDSGQTVLLNILDKIPKNVYIIANTTELHKIQKPIISRSIVFEFKLLSVKEMQQLLNSYLNANMIDFSIEVKDALIHAAKGIPRDLLKTTDLLIKGELSDNQIIELLEYVSDTSLYLVFSSLKSESVSFSKIISELMLSIPSNQLQSMRDFWARFILISKGSTEITIDKNILESLLQLYKKEDIFRITEMLLNTDDNKLVLDLIRLNMVLTNTTHKQMVGIQKVQQAAAITTSQENSNKVPVNKESQKLNKQTLQEFMLNK